MLTFADTSMCAEGLWVDEKYTLPSIFDNSRHESIAEALKNQPDITTQLQIIGK